MMLIWGGALNRGTFYPPDRGERALGQGDDGGLFGCWDGYVRSVRSMVWALDPRCPTQGSGTPC
jgi:hypothetical protein